VKADALTSRPGNILIVGDARLKNIDQVVLKPRNLLEQVYVLENPYPYRIIFRYPIFLPMHAGWIRE